MFKVKEGDFKAAEALNFAFKISSALILRQNYRNFSRKKGHNWIKTNTKINLPHLIKLIPAEVSRNAPPKQTNNCSPRNNIDRALCLPRTPYLKLTTFCEIYLILSFRKYNNRVCVLCAHVYIKTPTHRVACKH